MEGVFNERDARAIYSILVEVTSDEDMIIWSFSKDGRFTVRSISILLFYASLCEPRTPRSGGGWRKLWALKVSH